MFCKNCGTKIPEDSTYCHHCGVKIQNDVQLRALPLLRSLNEEQGSRKIADVLKKNITKRTLIFVVVISVILTMLFLLTSDGGMSSLDKKYDKIANKAAIELLQSEVSDRYWTTVETGDLVYLYTAKNAREDKFQVHYLAKFDEVDEPEDEWVELIISIDGNSDHIVDTLAVYWDADMYNAYFDKNDHYMVKFKSSYSAKGSWYNVNLSDTEFEEAKKEWE